MIDLARCLKAMQYIFVAGNPQGPAREEVIADAISAIQNDGQKALKAEYMGIKNYAHFGDQRCDCSYGMGPKHGSIVFRIGRRGDDRDATLGADEIYLLECVRDFGQFSNEHDLSHYQRPNQYNLCDLLLRRERIKDELGDLDQAIMNANVESHVRN